MFCIVYKADPNAPPWPELSKEFKMKVEATYTSKKKTVQVDEYYASYDNKAAIGLIDENQRLRLIFDYKANKLLAISLSQIFSCQATYAIALFM